MSPAMAAPRRGRTRADAVRPAGILCALALVVVGGGAVAHAERRPVAVVNLDLTNDPAPQALATQLSAVLEGHPELRALPVPGDIGALYERVDDKDSGPLERARQDVHRAREQIVEFDYRLAIKTAEEGMAELLRVTPSLATRVYAELALVLGEALLGDQRTDEAKAAFAHSHRLEPRTLDATRFNPQVVQTYDEATAPDAATGTIEVTGTGTVWIDGEELGIAPSTFTVAPGHHVVWLTGIDRETTGVRVRVAAGRPIPVMIPDAEAARRTKVQRARQALARAPDPTARAAAMTRLARLTGATDAVLLSSTRGALIVQTWRGGDGERAGFSAIRARGRATPLELLSPLSPPKIVAEVEPPPIVLPPPPKRWYQRRTVQLGIVAGVIAAIAGGVLIGRAGPDSFTPLENITVGGSGSIGRR